MTSPAPMSPAEAAAYCQAHPLPTTLAVWAMSGQLVLGRSNLTSLQLRNGLAAAIRESIAACRKAEANG